jgi:hypothetical protein
MNASFKIIEILNSFEDTVCLKLTLLGEPKGSTRLIVKLVIGYDAQQPVLDSKGF